jgi:two-component system, NarL family, response regulator LiaR
MSNASKIRVMIVDDHDLVRSGLRFYIQSVEDLILVGEAPDGSTAIELCRTLSPDVVLMDLVMPGMDGIETTRKIRQENPKVQVLALTSFSDHQQISEVIRAGAIGYLLKNVTINELTLAIRNARAGRPVLAPEALRTLVNPDLKPAAGPVYDLSSRELEVLTLVVAGLNNSEIAKNLSVSRSTIKTHVGNIFNKLGVSNRVEATTLAIQNYLVPPPDQNKT